MSKDRPYIAGLPVPTEQELARAEAELMSLAEAWAESAEKLPTSGLVGKSEIEVLRNSATSLKNDLNTIIALLKKSPPQDFSEAQVSLSLLHLLKLVLNAAYQVGGHLRVTTTVESLVKKATRALVQRKASKAAQAKRSPDKQARQKLVREAFRSGRIKTAAHIFREISKEGLKTTAKTVRKDLVDLGLVRLKKHRPKDGS